MLLLSVLTYSNSYTWLRTRRNYVRTFLIEKTIPTIRYSNSVGNSYSNSHSSYSRSGRIYSVRPTTFTTVDINTTPKK